MKSVGFYDRNIMRGKCQSFSTAKIPKLVLGGNNNFQIQSTLYSSGAKIEIGEYSSIVKYKFPQKDVDDFAVICDVVGPIHNDPEFAKTTIFKGTMVHGSLVSSLFTTLFGRTMEALHVEQTLNYRKPVLVGADVTATIEVIKIEPKTKGDFITCKTTVTLADGSLAVDGIGKVLVSNMMQKI